MLKSAITGRAPRSSHGHVVQGIGRSIVGGAYRVGDILPGDADLAERFHVSRTVLREAMKTLGAKGMVVARARIGTRVTERNQWNLFDADVLAWHFDAGVDRDFLDHLCEMRLGFEPRAAMLAATHASAEDIATLYRHAEAMRIATTDEAFAIADLRLHLALLDASGNPFMHSVGTLIEAALATSFTLTSPTEDPARAALSAAAHRSIAEAIEARDPAAAARAVEAVIQVGRDRVADRVIRGSRPSV